MKDVERIWKEFAVSKEHSLKEKLILEYAPLVKFVAGRLSMHIGQYVEYDDLVSYGIFGLIDAIDKFDIEKGVKFETYASLRIRGAIIDSIRKMDWVPRTLRQKNRQVENVYEQLESSLGREPTEHEVAEKLGVPIEELQDMLKKSNLNTLISLDDYLDQNHESSKGMINLRDDSDPQQHFDKTETKKMLVEAIEKLSEKEKKVITLYYFEELTLKEISVIMGVSESRISQIHSKAILKLQSKLGKFKAMLYSV